MEISWVTQYKGLRPMKYKKAILLDKCVLEKEQETVFIE